MAKLKDLVDKNKLMLYLLLIAAAFIVFDLAHREPRVSIQPVEGSKMTEVEKLARENHELRERLARLEPVTPVKIVTADQPSRSVETVPVLAVMEEGTHVPFEIIYEDPSWVRPDYQPYWHSRQKTGSSLPDRIHNSYRRLFVSAGNETLWAETMNDSGIAELAGKISLAGPGDKPDDTVAVVVFRHQVIDVLALKGQVVLLGRPTRTGVQVLAVDKKDLTESVSGESTGRSNSREFLFQMVTPDGYEVDYCSTVIGY